MKTHLIHLSVCALLVFAAGCASPTRVAQMEGKGEARVFAAPFEAVWRATIDAAQINSLEVQNADPASGYIATRRGFGLGTTGENVGIWVTRISPFETQVEVVSRSAGPPRPLTRNWERRVLNAVEANLTREMAQPGLIAPRDPAGGGL